MSTINHSFCVLALAGGIAVATAGCQHAIESEPVELAPYETTSTGTLKVRDDLADLLRFARARTETVSGRLQGYGTLTFAPGASYAVRVPFEGIIDVVEVRNGADVEDGQVLATLRSRDLAKLRADINRIEATTNAERATLERLEGLVESGAISQKEVLQVRARVAALDAELGGIRTELTAARAEPQGDDLYLVRADHSGQVLDRSVEPGEHVDVDNVEPAFLIGDASKLIVTAQFPERDAPLLAVGQPVHIHVGALGDEEAIGCISAIVRAINVESRTIRVECALAAPDPRLHSEMSARVDVDVVGPPQLVVPHAAVLLRREARVVIVRREGNELERRKIQVGARIGDHVQILSGLSEGEEVVVDGAVLLDGELDRVIATI